MDTLVHGVIGAALCSRTGLAGGRRGPVDEQGRRQFSDWTFWAALGFGLFPDLASLGIHFSMDLFAGNGMRWHGIPDFIFVLYDITHSLAGMAVCLGLLDLVEARAVAAGAGLAHPCADGCADPRQRPFHDADPVAVFGLGVCRLELVGASVDVLRKLDFRGSLVVGGAGVAPVVEKNMKFLELVNRRQSVRRYQPGRKIPREALERCLEAARLAPSACNSQPWSFVVADDPAQVRALAEEACGMRPMA